MHNVTLEQKFKKALKSKNESEILNVFEECYNQYYKLIYFVIIRYISNHDTLELINDVFLSFFNHLDKIKFDNIKSYLVAIAKNKVINFIKQKENSPTIIFDDSFIYQINYPISNDYEIILQQMKTVLSDFAIEIILQHVIYDKTFKQISNEYHKPLNTIISIYNRAIKKFKGVYKKWNVLIY